MWEPVIHQRFDLPHDTVFLVTCGPEFTRAVGCRVRLEGKVWEVLGWDDHRTVGAPHDGENIPIRVREVVE